MASIDVTIIKNKKKTKLQAIVKDKGRKEGISQQFDSVFEVGSSL